eukprot:CAMPEP_0198729636 /NCGR_PEP_ID=MMETSP1475-20131203/20264_1 /TAXON_ID= ORGANISM="Unidentified sp., Strain CCMP1999" /NCGR_SAMPLE_ID=MMETSP1475 /ASSEMBLY_ACC=CAM_ASM_001111 /LENGTH=402 /DNA_ID=CAMNT_0044492329 /DNA_START=113 /DNA_END=1320 /DNA_ORIENTATION=-
MRWLSAGSIVGLAQAVLINAIDVHRGVLLRAGLELAEEQPTPSVHPDRAEQPQQMPPMPQMPQMLPPIDPRKKQAIRSMPEVGADAPAAVLSPYRLKPMDSSSDSDGIRSDYSMSEVTADSEVTSSELASDEYVPQADSVPHACLEVDRVDLGKVDAMKLVMESTRAVAVGRVLPFEQFSAAVRNLLYIVDALLMDMRKAHQFISGDIVNNLRKVEKAMQSTNTECMEEMVLTEVQMGVKYKNSGREALLWLKRTLVFIYTCSTFAAERDCALVKSVKDAYNVVPGAMSWIPRACDQVHDEWHPRKVRFPVASGPGGGPSGGGDEDLAQGPSSHTCTPVQFLYKQQAGEARQVQKHPHLSSFCPDNLPEGVPKPPLFWVPGAQRLEFPGVLPRVQQGNGKVP